MIPCLTDFPTARSRAVGLVLAAWLAANAMGGETPAPENLLKNPGFEEAFEELPKNAVTPQHPGVQEGRVGVHWKPNSGWADLTLAFDPDPNPFKGKGAQRIRCTRRTGGRTQFVQPVKVQKNRGYEISAWVKGSGRVSLELRKSGAPYTSHFATGANVLGEWSKLSVRGTAPEDDEAFFFLAFDGTGWFSVDEAEMVVLPERSNAPPKAGNLIYNGGFELGLAGWGGQLREWNGYANSPEPHAKPYPDPLDVAGYESGDAGCTVTQAEDRQAGRAALLVDLLPNSWWMWSSRGVAYNFGRPHLLSFWAKAERPGAALYATLYSENRFRDTLKKFVLSAEWTRYEMTLTPPYSSSAVMGAYFECHDTGKILLDGVHIQEGETFTPDAPRLEAALAAPRETGPVMLAAERPRILLRLASPVDGPVRCEVRVVDVDEREVQRLEREVAVKQGWGEAEAELETGALGAFRAMLKAVQGKQEAAGECCVGLPPDPVRGDEEASAFGGHFPFGPYYLKLMPKLGMKWARLHPPFHTKWIVVERERGQFRWYDAELRAVRAAGLKILGSLDLTPHWASVARETQQPGWVRSSATFPAERDEDWTNYVSKTVTHYAGVVDDWEIWNEPFTGTFFGVPEGRERGPEYVRLVRLAAEAARKANPRARVMGGMAGPDYVWTRECLDMGLHRLTDVFTLHLYYGGNGAPEFDGPLGLRDSVGRLREALRSAHRPDEVWNSEGGLSGATRSWYSMPELERGFVVPAREHAEQTAKYYVVQLAAGIRRGFQYFSWASPPHMGAASEATFLHADGTPRPAALAYAAAALFLHGARAKDSGPHPEDVAYFAFDTPAGEVQVFWSSAGKPVAFETRIPDGARIADLMGNARALALANGAARLEAGSAPQYLLLPPRR
ncbi:MAG: carbohydrate binding domain-containing protein [Planctomycetota bacterium]|nr:carbohydrate binding domain-containing protein [Planctomycetota bacterium]